MIDALVACTFAARNLDHLSHWNTDSYAEHMALGDFYEELPDLVDSLVEAYQGLVGKIGMVHLTPYDDDDILSVLKDDVEWMNKHRSDICKDFGALENLLDNIGDLYLTTIYKLENLK